MEKTIVKIPGSGWPGFRDAGGVAASCYVIYPDLKVRIWVEFYPGLRVDESRQLTEQEEKSHLELWVKKEETVTPRWCSVYERENTEKGMIGAVLVGEHGIVDPDSFYFFQKPSERF